MLRFMGGGLVVGSFTWLGVSMARELRRRPEELRQLQTALQVLRTEIDWGAVPLPEALDRAAASACGAIRDMLTLAGRELAGGSGRGAGDAWRLAVDRIYPRTAITREDRQILIALATCLGVSHRDDQLRHLSVCIERLRGAEAEAHVRAEKNARLYQHMGLLGGLLLTLLAI